MELLVNNRQSEMLSGYNLAGLPVPVDTPIKPVDLTYCCASHEREIDFDQADEPAMRAADAIFFEQIRWKPEHRVAIRQIARGVLDGLRTVKPETYSYRKYKAVFGSNVTLDFWDLSDRELEQATPREAIAEFNRSYAEAESLLLKKQDEEAIKEMTNAKLALARLDRMRDIGGLRRIVNRIVTYQGKEQPKREDGIYSILVFTGVAHAFQAAAFANAGLGGLKKVSINSLFTENAIDVGNGYYGEFLSGNDVYPEAIAKSWLLHYQRIMERHKIIHTAWANIDNANAENIKQMNYDEVIKTLIKVAPK